MPANPIGLSTFILASPFSLEDAWAFDRVAELGYDVIEVCIEDPQKITSEWLVHESQRTGTDIGICGAFGPDRDVSDPDPRRRDNGMAYLRDCVDVAAAVGSPMSPGPCSRRRAGRNSWSPVSVRPGGKTPRKAFAR